MYLAIQLAGSGSAGQMFHLLPHAAACAPPRCSRPRCRERSRRPRWRQRGTAAAPAAAGWRAAAPAGRRGPPPTAPRRKRLLPPIQAAAAQPPRAARGAPPPPAETAAGFEAQIGFAGYQAIHSRSAASSSPARSAAACSGRSWSSGSLHLKPGPGSSTQFVQMLMPAAAPQSRSKTRMTGPAR